MLIHLTDHKVVDLEAIQMMHTEGVTLEIHTFIGTVSLEWGNPAEADLARRLVAMMKSGDLGPVGYKVDMEKLAAGISTLDGLVEDIIDACEESFEDLLEDPEILEEAS